ncbi:lipocalin/fatty acid-binding family protein [Limnoglobus roseus]|uniref:TIGR03066 family protein n=1 Tax=Limnoglobus roseus TaxID=2598579 RepID=A0A5C1ANP5_9BACT|nr:hypothetical protein [Limnoglobus roseus]QEL20861.1 hypothetical protein PX52LOC_07981 [Limnoglobus roseus]
MRMFAIAALVLGLTGLVHADDKKTDPTGTWKWTVERNGQKTERSVKLELKDGKLTGTSPTPDGKETKLEDGTFKDGDVTFTIHRENNGQKMTIKYKGKIEGDSFKGTAEVDAGGETRKVEFDAKREKAK